MSPLTHARYRRAIRVRGHFPNEQAALKCLHPVTRPDWDRPAAMDDALETSIERIRDHFRRSHAGKETY